MKEILTILISIGSVFSVGDGGQTVTMVNFGGVARGECFNGRVLAGGVDTQHHYPDGRSSLSARYMLEGVDSLGDSCRVFVENTVRPETPQGQSEPTIVTSSPYLRRLAAHGLTGRLDFRNDTLTIRVLAKE